MSVALSAAVAEVSAALRALHVVTSLCTLDMNLQTDARGGEIQEFLTFVGLTRHLRKSQEEVFGKEAHSREGEWTKRLSITFKETKHIFYCQLSHYTTAQGFLLVKR